VEDTKTNGCLSAALAYALRGWHVFPAPRGEKKSHKSGEFSGRKWGKTTDPGEIARDYRRWPEANVGIATGAESGIWVVETDTEEGHGVDGEAALCTLEEKNDALPDTLTGQSPSGSVHRYFRYPKDREIRNSTSAIAPGVDVRGEGGMVIAPPSVKPGRGAYVWISNAPIADAPQWLIELAIAASGNGGERAPNEEPEADLGRVAAALAVVPNDDLDWENWNRIGMATYAATGGNGFAAFDAWSQKSKKHVAKTTIDRWHNYSKRPPDRIGAGTIFHLANKASPWWEDAYHEKIVVASDEEFFAHIGIAIDAPKTESESQKSENEAPKSENKTDGGGESKTNGANNQKQSDDQPGDLIVVRLADVESKRINWLWKPRIARGKLTLVVGMPDVSKSTFSLDLAARITRGGSLPNGEGEVPLGSVVILSAEDDASDTIKPRFEVAGGDVERVHIVTAVRGKQKGTQRTFDLTQDVARLELIIKNIGDVALVIIDPFSAYMGKPGKLDTFRSTDVRATLAPLQRMAARHGVAVVGIGHLNKSGSLPVLLRVLDSVAFVASARGVYLVVRDPADEERRLFLPVKNNIGKIRTGLSFRVVEKPAPPPVLDEQPAIEWDNGAINMTADEAMTWKEDGRKSEAAEPSEGPHSRDARERTGEDVGRSSPRRGTRDRGEVAPDGEGRRRSRLDQDRNGLVVVARRTAGADVGRRPGTEFRGPGRSPYF
jgi:hypothetical protein